MRILRVERERQETSLERQRKQRWIKLRKISVVVAVATLAVIGCHRLVQIWEKVMERKKQEKVLVAEEKYQPTVQIIDEQRIGTEISEHVKEIVGRLERDVRGVGLEIEKVVIPPKKVKELDVFLKGKTWLVRVNLDRGTAETAEDLGRMVKLFEEQGIKVKEYIDLRVAGRGYYK